MADLISDSINFGFGLFAYSRERIEQFVEKMVDQGKIQRQDAQSFAHDMIAEGEAQRKEVKKMVQDTVREDLQAMGITPGGQCGAPATNGVTAEEIRQIVREELDAQKSSTGAKESK